MFPKKSQCCCNLLMGCILSILTIQNEAFSPVLRQCTHRYTPLYANRNAIDALRSLNDFHEGTWKGKSTSFTITNDLASGVVQRKSLNAYMTTVKVGLDVDKKEAKYKLSETFEWESKVSIRSLNLVNSNIDVDSVDGSYSLDSSCTTLPASLIGTGNLLPFYIEHAIAINDNERIRCFILYGLEKSLSRIVICEEERLDDKKKIPFGNDPPINSLSPLPSPRPAHSSTLPSDVTTPQLARHSTNLLELSSGVWLGDAIVRTPNSYEESRGFNPGRKSSKISLKKKSFANWSVGVQKLAIQWHWNFGETLRKDVNVGKPLGIGLDEGFTMPISGVVCTNESLSGRIPKDERLVFVDWSSSGSVWFLLNHVSIQVSFLRSVLTYSKSDSWERRLLKLTHFRSY